MHTLYSLFHLLFLTYSKVRYLQSILILQKIKVSLKRLYNSFYVLLLSARDGIQTQNLPQIQCFFHRTRLPPHYLLNVKACTRHWPYRSEACVQREQAESAEA